MLGETMGAAIRQTTVPVRWLDVTVLEFFYRVVFNLPR